METLRITRALCDLLGCSFEIPVSKLRVFPIDQPEILLGSLIIVSAKLTFTHQHSLIGEDSGQRPESPRLNWARWAEKMEAAGEVHTELEDLENKYGDVSPERIATMTSDELDMYFKYVATLVDSKSEPENILFNNMVRLTFAPGEGPLTKFFPIEDPSLPEPARAENSDAELIEQTRKIFKEIAAAPQDHEDHHTYERGYEAFRSADSLTSPALQLYHHAGIYPRTTPVHGNN